MRSSWKTLTTKKLSTFLFNLWSAANPSLFAQAASLLFAVEYRWKWSFTQISVLYTSNLNVKAYIHINNSYIYHLCSLLFHLYNLNTHLEGQFSEDLSFKLREHFWLPKTSWKIIISRKRRTEMGEKLPSVLWWHPHFRINFQILRVICTANMYLTAYLSFLVRKHSPNRISFHYSPKHIQQIYIYLYILSILTYTIYIMHTYLQYACSGVI